MANSTAERVFWRCVLVVTIVFFALVMKDIFAKYFSFSVYVDSRLVKTHKLSFPAVTFCNAEFDKNTYCGLSGDLPVMESDSDVDIDCYKESTKLLNTQLRINVTGIHKELQMYSLEDERHVIQFTVACAPDAACRMSYVSEQFFKVTEESPGNCVTWNPNGTFYNAKSKIEFLIKMRGKSLSKDIALYVHDHKESPLTMDYFIPSNINQNLDLVFYKVVSETSGPPISDCVDEESDKDMFPGKYTRVGCLDTNMCTAILRDCGGSLDFCEKYMSKALLRQYQRNNEKNRDIYKCIQKGFREERFNVSPFLCPPPCKKTRFRTIPSSYVKNKDENTTTFKLRLRYQERNLYELNVEKLVYTWYDLMSSIGGTVGLLCGCSILSLFELIIYLALKIYARQTRKKE